MLLTIYPYQMTAILIIYALAKSFQGKLEETMQKNLGKVFFLSMLAIAFDFISYYNFIKLLIQQIHG
jgi:hypothetical protein